MPYWVGAAQKQSATKKTAGLASTLVLLGQAAPVPVPFGGFAPHKVTQAKKKVGQTRKHVSQTSEDPAQVHAEARLVARSGESNVSPPKKKRIRNQKSFLV